MATSVVVERGRDEGTRSMERRYAFLASLALLAMLAGCGGSEPIRHPLRGTVRVDGVAIENGSISFLPVRGTSGTPATTLIVRGEYQFTSETGPYSGRHRVVVGADPNQIFAVQNQSQDSDRDPQSVSDVETPTAASPKLAPARQLETPQESESRQSGVGKATEDDEKPQLLDPGRNQWDMQYEVPAELTRKKDFDFVTSKENLGTSAVR